MKKTENWKKKIKEMDMMAPEVLKTYLQAACIVLFYQMFHASRSLEWVTDRACNLQPTIVDWLQISSTAPIAYH